MNLRNILSHRNIRLLQVAAIAAWILCISACNHIGPNPRRIDSSPKTAQQELTADLRWWQNFDSQELNRCIFRALQQNETGHPETEWSRSLTNLNEIAGAFIKRKTSFAQIREVEGALRGVAPDSPEHISLSRHLNALMVRYRKQEDALSGLIGQQLAPPTAQPLNIPAPPERINLQILQRRPDLQEEATRLQQTYRLIDNPAPSLRKFMLSVSDPADLWQRDALTNIHFPILHPEDRTRLNISSHELSQARKDYMIQLSRAITETHGALRKAHITYGRIVIPLPEDATMAQRIAHLDNLQEAALGALNLRIQLGGEW